MDKTMVVGLLSDARDFILLQSFQTVSEAHSSFKSMGIKGFFSPTSSSHGVKLTHHHRLMVS
jgi:hypothetical protein